MYTDFHQLDIWKIGYEILMKIYSLSDTFPETEKYGLTSQIRRSANSVIANIAESHGRYHYQDKKRVLYISRGEIFETRSHLAVVYGQKLISKEEFEHLNKKYEELTKRLNSYINHLKK
ncbi:MAG: four helix bundle protein [Candidatus Magasanikbacteria bacterium]